MRRKTVQQLRDDALRIWQAGVAAVDSERLVRQSLIVEGPSLVVGDEQIDLESLRRIVVVGCGKAGAGMAAGIESALASVTAEKQLLGWVNVPADCVRALPHIHLHAARPAGRNEPTREGVFGTERMLQLADEAHADDLMLCLISGGGSALMPAPIAGVSLDEKLTVTRFLSAAGADITELNTVRKALSRVKGGGLARACRAGRLIALIISDVLGDPLDMIASGPTVAASNVAVAALAVLRKFEAHGELQLAGVVSLVERLAASNASVSPPTCRVSNIVIGNNAVAVDAAGMEAERLGYVQAMVSATTPEGPAEDVGRHLADMAIAMRGATEGPDCLISGGEPTVRLAPESERGKGGRNQQLALAAMQRLQQTGAGEGIALLSGGTDGEDGPTDAAGALIDESLVAAYRDRKSEVADALRRNDAYRFFDPCDRLIKTGPTHTNVCDVRVVLVDRD